MTVTTEFDPFESIATNSAGLASAAADNFAATVEHCPGWSVADLVRHVWQVHRFWAQIVELRLSAPPEFQPAAPPADAALLEEFRRGAARLVEILRAAEPATPVWTWSSQQDAAFVIRHQVQEVAVHRWDAEHAAGREFAIDPAAASDAVLELLTFSLGPRQPTKPSLDKVICLQSVDTGAAWTLRPGGADRLEVHPGAQPAALTIDATAADLLLMLYDRVPVDALTVTGDAGLLDLLGSYVHAD